MPLVRFATTSRRRFHGGTLILAFAAMLLAGADARQASAQDGRQAYFYSGGKKNFLQTSTQWAGVQLENGDSAASVESRFAATGAMAQAVSPMLNRRKNVLVLPLQQSAGPTKREDANAWLQQTKGVKRALRVFGSGGNPVVETDEILVRFKAGLTAEARAALLKKYDLSLVRSLLKTPDGFVLRTNKPDTNPATDAANALFESGQVLLAHPNYIWTKKPRFIPNDPLYPSQWHLNNSGQSDGTVGADIKAENAWNLSRGSSSVTIAVIDDGFDLAHEEFQGGKLVAGFDFVDNDSDPSPGASDNHGTVVAGLAAANANNALGVAGVAPNVKLMPIRLVSFGATLEDEHDAFIWAADQGADVISCSWGPQDGNNIEQPLPDITKQGIDYAADNGRGGKGCVIFFAAGNGFESADLDGYSSYSKVISVAATTNKDLHAAYSDFGNSVDLAAPGGGQPGTLSIVTTDRTGSAGYISNSDYYPSFTGTSASCPIAAGVAALALSVNSALTRTQVQTLMQNTADKVGGLAYNSSGRNTELGYGRINALAVLQGAASYFTAGGTVTLANGTGVSGVDITASGTNGYASTASNGAYVVQMPAGTRTITPSKPGFYFTPATRTVTVGPNAVNQNFVALEFKVSLLAPASNSTVFSTVTLRASTTLDSVVQSMQFARRTPPITFTRTPNKTIPDAPSDSVDGVASDTQAVSGSGTAESASVTVNITHPYSGDLVIKLYPPTGSAITLQEREGGNTPNVSRTFNIPLSSPNIAGNWKLEVADTDPLPSGTATLNSWGMTINPTWTLLATDSDGPSAGEWTANWNTALTTPGVYDVRARAVRADGNGDAINTNITVTTAPTDSTPPTVTVTSPANNSVIK